MSEISELTKNWYSVLVQSSPHSLGPSNFPFSPLIYLKNEKVSRDS